MPRIRLILVLLLAALPAHADSAWLYGRIESVNKSVNTRTKVWVVNTPITEDETTYTISVHVQDRIIVGTYDLTPEESAPPEEWTQNYPLKVQITGDRLYLRAPTGDLSLHIVRRKIAKPVAPLTADEKKRLEQLEAPAGSLVGFSSDKASPGNAPPEPVPAPPPAPLPPTTGLVNIRSLPYLSEVFVDGDSMGYTPAKVSLPPGKHSFRVEKPGYKSWTKEITITIGSELTLDATLEKK